MKAAFSPQQAQALWEHIFGDARGFLQVWTGIRVDGEIPDDTTNFENFPYPSKREAAAQWAGKKAQEGRETYFCAHLLRPAKQPKRSKEGAAEVHALWADLDGVEVPNGELAPTATVESSPGKFHCYWRLADALPPEVAEDLNRRLASKIGADSGWHLTKILRVPGTLNFKYAGGRAVKIANISDAAAYAPRELDELLPKLEKPEPEYEPDEDGDEEEPPVVLDPEDLEVWRGERPKLTDSGEIDRSASLLKIGRVLFDAGASRRVVIAALKERDAALGWNKYISRTNADECYADIFAELKRNGRTPKLTFTAEGGLGDENGRRPPANPEKVGMTKALADAITATEHFAQDAGGKLYRFSDGVYKQFGERFIKRQVKELAEAWGETKKWSAHRASEVTEFIRADAPLLWERPPLEEVNLKNGILNIQTRELRDHDPAFLSTVQIPVGFDPDATCPEWDAFVASTFPEDAQALAYELAADLMTPKRSQQKSILLIGEGSNGKSTYLTALTNFVGSTNVVGLSLQKMESDRFSSSRLLGKLANVCPDLPSSHLVGTSMFKAVTGSDAINAEYKYRESFEFRPFTRLVFSANQVPRSEDATHAFFRRWLVVPFDRTFDEGEQIPRQELDAKLADPRELSGVLNKALDALPGLRKNGFTESPSMKAAWEEFRAMTDPVSVWLDKNTVEHPDAYVPRNVLWQTYNDHTEHAKLTKKAFGQALKRARPHIAERQVTIGERRTWCWMGIALKAKEPDPPDEPGRDSRYERGERSLAAQRAQDAQDSTNCFLNEVGADNTEERAWEQEEITNKGNPVHPVHPVHGVEPTVDKALDAMRHGNAPRKVVSNIHEGTQGLEDLARSVMHFYGAKRFDGWEAWLGPVMEAFEVLAAEEEAAEGGVA